MEFSLFKRKEAVGSVKQKPMSYLHVTEEDLSTYAILNNDNLKVIHYTHTDIAGSICGVLGMKAFKNIETHYLSNDDVNDAINTFTNIERRYTDYDLILISDVALNRGTLLNLNMVQKVTNGQTKVVYCNHIESLKEFTDQYPWCLIEPTGEDGVKQDSSFVLYKYLINNYNLPKEDWLDNLVQTCSDYTTWAWSKKDDVTPLNLSTLCHDMGASFFAETMIKKHIALDSLLSKEDYAKLKHIDAKYEKYKNKKMKTVDLFKIDGKRVGFVIAEQYIDRLASDIMKQYNHLHEVVIINSFEKMNVRGSAYKNTDVSLTAKSFGGDGGKRSAGAIIPMEIRESVVAHFIELSTHRFNKN